MQEQRYDDRLTKTAAPRSTRFPIRNSELCLGRAWNVMTCDMTVRRASRIAATFCVVARGS